MNEIHPATQTLLIAALIQFWFIPLVAWWMLGKRYDRPARLWFSGTAVYALACSLYVVSWMSPGGVASLGVVIASTMSVILLIEAMRQETSTKRTPWVPYSAVLCLEFALQIQQFQPGMPTSALAGGIHLSVLAGLDITLLVFLWRAHHRWQSASLKVIAGVFAVFALSNLWRVIELLSNPTAPGLLDLRGSGQAALLLNMLSVVFYSFGYWGFVLDKSMTRELLANQERVATEQRQALLEHMGRLGRLAQGGALSAAIAHEINQPLAALHLGLDTALALLGKDPHPGGQHWGSILERAREHASRVHQVIERIRELFRHSPKSKVSQDFDAMVRRVIDLLHHRLDSHKVEVSFIGGVSHPVWLIPGEVEHIVLNLVENAIQALSTSSAPRRVTLFSGESQDGECSLLVTDNGPGIDPALRPFVFDLAFTDRAGGTGMGLWLARHIAERHGGHLTIIPSELPGCTFKLALPREEVSVGAST